MSQEGDASNRRGGFQDAVGEFAFFRHKDDLPHLTSPRASGADHTQPHNSTAQDTPRVSPSCLVSSVRCCSASGCF